jgi:two-component system, OmpR family, sensor histidine kinase VicK
VIYSVEEIINRELEAFPGVGDRIDACYDHTGPSALVPTEPIWKALAELAKRGIRLRYITDITKGNISYCREMMKYFEIHHLDGAHLLSKIS